MQEFFFAHYRLLVSEAICNHESMQYLSEFKTRQPYTHTFVLKFGGDAHLDSFFSEAVLHKIVCSTDLFDIHDIGDGWAFLPSSACLAANYCAKHVLICSRDYAEMTLYMSLSASVPVSMGIRVACESGMAMREGIPLHASLVERDGFGVLFLGPSGMGKSTQAKLWAKYQGADFIIGDRPSIRKIDGIWYGYGMPWDGKDRIKRQKCVPLKALVFLEQAKENAIRQMSEQESIMMLLRQMVMPMWDEKSMDMLSATMGQLVSDIPFFHLRNLPDEEATTITRKAVYGC